MSSEGFPSHGIGLRHGHPGEVLGRLVALFGHSARIGDDGVTFVVRDTQTGLAFAVGVHVGGATFFAISDERALRPVIAAFEALLDRTVPADCSVTIGGDLTIGCQGGEPFERRGPTATAGGLTAASAARSALADDSASALASYGAFLNLSDALTRAAPTECSAEAWELATALWRKSLSAGLTELAAELARGRKADRNAVTRLVEVLLPGLASTSEVAKVDYSTELAEHRSLVARARKSIRRGR